jgi:hypothetical protein
MADMGETLANATYKALDERQPFVTGGLTNPMHGII